MKIRLRDRRQITLPREATEALGISEGDSLQLEVLDGALLLRPSKRVALDAIEAIRKALHDAGVTEEELLEGGRRIREELFREKYPHLAEKYGI